MRQEKMNMPKIKICGLSRPEDITYINERNRIIADLSSICQRAGEMYPFRKFVNWFKILIRRFARSEYLSIKTAVRSQLLNEGTLQIAQLHGQEDEAYIQKLKSI